MEHEGAFTTDNGVSPATAYATDDMLPANRRMRVGVGIGHGKEGNPLLYSESNAPAGGSGRRGERGRADDYHASYRGDSGSGEEYGHSGGKQRSHHHHKRREKKERSERSRAYESSSGSGSIDGSSVGSRVAPSISAYAVKGSEPDDRVLPVQIRATLRELMSSGDKDKKRKKLVWNGREMMALLNRQGCSDLTPVGGISISKASNGFPMPFVVVYDVMRDEKPVLPGSVLHFFLSECSTLGTLTIDGMKSDDVFQYIIIPEVSEFGETWFHKLNKQRCEMAKDNGLPQYTVSNFQTLNITATQTHVDTEDPHHPYLEYGRKAVQMSAMRVYPAPEQASARANLEASTWSNYVQELSDSATGHRLYRIVRSKAAEWAKHIIEWDSANHRKVGDLPHTNIRLLPQVSSQAEATADFWDRFPQSSYFKEYFPDKTTPAEIDEVLDTVFSFSCNITVQIPQSADK